MLTGFKEGQGVSWSVDDRSLYGIVVKAHDVLDVVPVFKAGNGTRCYDEGGSNYDTDRHKIRLRDCPPPFTLLCAFSEYGCYADADVAGRYCFSEQDVADTGMIIVDDGDLVSDRHMSEIRDHLWRDEVQMHKHAEAPVDSCALVAVIGRKPARRSTLSQLLRHIQETGSPEPECDGPEF